MTIEIHKPELEKLMREEIGRGRFQSVDDLLIHALHALRGAGENEPDAAPRRQPKVNFARFLMDSPLPGSGLKLERPKDRPRQVEL